MGRQEPRAGLEGKFSVQHCIAAGLVDGAAYPAQFADAKVADPVLVALRSKVKLSVDPAMEEDQVRLVLTFKDGTVWEENVEHATGAPQNPLTDRRLEEKFLALAASTLGEARSQALLDRLWRLDEAASVAEIDLSA
jgi:2-methylcitrate dehydratase PrpD